ncbi:hypothetical protein TNCV_1259711 [Trichonephila clavipes]|nr:hypothetical protein TNCV_1259711 [Trichonephila clavipes]
MPAHRMLQRLHRQLREARSSYVSRHYAGRRSAVRSSSLEKRILNVVADRPKLSARDVAHHRTVSLQTVCTVLNENRLHLFHFQRIEALNTEDYFFQLL